jgi:G3E family GTPase
MKLIMIAGYLGSGKTTLLLHTARTLKPLFQKIVIIENEVGTVGIDGQYLAQEGLEIQELFGGCVCCTLRADLLATLDRINKTLAPDLILLEPTGLSNPQDLETVIREHGPALDRIEIITLIDPTRFEMLWEVVTPLITSQIKAATVLVINKVDLVEQESLAPLVAQMASLNPRADILCLSAEKEINLEALWKKWI